jgi:hypothetical protein
MKRLAKSISMLVLAIILMASACALPAHAYSTAQENSAQTLYNYGLFRGTGVQSNGTPIFDLDKVPTRNQAIIMLVRLLGKESEALEGNWNIPFTDVSSSMRPYIGYAYTNGLTNGTSASTYSGGAAIPANQYIAFVLRALCYHSGSDFEVATAWKLSDAIGLTAGQYAGTSEFTRGDVADISCTALNTTLNESSSTLLEKLNENGFGKATLVTWTYRADYYKKNNAYYGGAGIEGINVSEFNGEQELYISAGSVLEVLEIMTDSAELGSSENPYLAGEYKSSSPSIENDGDWSIFKYKNFTYGYRNRKAYDAATLQETTLCDLRYSYKGKTCTLMDSPHMDYSVYYSDGVRSYVSGGDNHEPLHYVKIKDVLSQLGITGSVTVSEVENIGAVWSLS